MATICVFGDSTVWGAWDLERGGRVNHLWLFLAHKDQDAELYNLSISGGTTEIILVRFEFENEAKIREADTLHFSNWRQRCCLRTPRRQSFSFAR